MANDKVKTPFRYPGGKYYALKYLLPYIAQIPHEEYREPFVGGGSVFFGKPKVAVSWINDIDPELVNVYQIFKSDKYYELLKKLTKETASPERYLEIRASKPKSKFDAAFRYYYMNRTSYSGKLISASWGYREKRSVPPHRWDELVVPAHGKLQKVKITNNDFEKIISAPSNRKTFIYVDPPYFLPAKKKHYVNGFKLEDHLRLERILRKTKHSFLLSYEDCKEVRDLYKWANVYQMAFPYRVGDSNTSGLRRKTGNEVIITNIKLEIAKGYGKR